MSLEKIVQSMKRSKKGIKEKTLQLLLGVALIAGITGCGRKVEIKERAMPMEVLKGVIAGTDIVKETYNNILVPNDGKPEFFISLDEMVATPSVKIYVDNDFKDKVGNFDIIFLGRGDGSGFVGKHFNYNNKYKRDVYSDSLEISARIFDFILSSGCEEIRIEDLLYAENVVKHHYRRSGKTIIWNFY